MVCHHLDPNIREEGDVGECRIWWERRCV